MWSFVHEIRRGYGRAATVLAIAASTCGLLIAASASASAGTTPVTGGLHGVTKVGRLKTVPGGVTVLLRCSGLPSQTCFGDVTLTTGQSSAGGLVAKRAYTVATGASKTITIKLAGKWQKRLRSLGTLQVTVTVRGTVEGAFQPILTRTVTISK